MDKSQFTQVLLKTLTDREIVHGNSDDTLSTIAEVWTSVLNRIFIQQGATKEIILHPAHVSLLMNALKICRAIENPYHIDNWVDQAGYAACGAISINKELEGSEEFDDE